MSFYKEGILVFRVNLRESNPSWVINIYWTEPTFQQALNNQIFHPSNQKGLVTLQVEEPLPNHLQLMALQMVNLITDVAQISLIYLSIQKSYYQWVSVIEQKKTEHNQIDNLPQRFSSNNSNDSRRISNFRGSQYEDSNMAMKLWKSMATRNIGIESGLKYWLWQVGLELYLVLPRVSPGRSSKKVSCLHEDRVIWHNDKHGVDSPGMDFVNSSGEVWRFVMEDLAFSSEGVLSWENLRCSIET